MGIGWLYPNFFYPKLIPSMSISQALRVYSQCIRLLYVRVKSWFSNTSWTCQNTSYRWNLFNHYDDIGDLDIDDNDDDVKPVRAPSTDETPNHEAKHVSTACKCHLVKKRKNILRANPFERHLHFAQSLYFRTPGWTLSPLFLQTRSWDKHNFGKTRSHCWFWKNDPGWIL